MVCYCNPCIYRHACRYEHDWPDRNTAQLVVESVAVRAARSPDPANEMTVWDDSVNAIIICGYSAACAAIPYYGENVELKHFEGVDDILEVDWE